MRLPKTQRLRVQADFARVRSEGLRAECGSFILNALRKPDAGTPHGAVRLGVVCSRKLLGNAVCRNRMRRVFKEIFRRHLEAWPPGWDVLIVPRRSSLKKTSAALEQRYLETCAQLLRRAGENNGNGAPHG
jgi:ribonuclease P protein component